MRLALNGATGRMGRVVREVVRDRDGVTLAAGVAPGGGEPAVPVVTPDERLETLRSRAVDVVVDFSAPAAVPGLARDCERAGVGLVTGTTGLDEEASDALDAAGEAVPVVHASNFSRGVHALERALDAALDSLPGYDIELLETHHAGKRDAPSGTARSLLETVADHREFETITDRTEAGPRGADEVGVFSRRAGGVRGEHELLLAANDEQLALTHRAGSRRVFAAGALDAATWLAGRDPGRYDVAAVFAGPGERGDRR